MEFGNWQLEWGISHSRWGLGLEFMYMPMGKKAKIWQLSLTLIYSFFISLEYYNYKELDVST